MVDQNETAPGNALEGVAPAPLADKDSPDPVAERDEAAMERIWGKLAASEEGEWARDQEEYEAPSEDDASRAGADEDSEGEEGSPEPESQREEAPAPTQDQPDDEAYRLSVAALRRDGWSTEDIALLPRERVTALGDKRRKVQDDTDTAFAELTEFRAGRGAARENEARRGENEAEASPAQIDVSKIADRLALDEDGARELADFIRSSQAPLLQELVQARQASTGAQKMAMQAAAEAARRDLAERFPQVQDAKSDSYRRVLNRMTAIQGQGNYESVTQLMEDAILLEHGPDIAKQASERSQRLSKARANGQAMTSGKKGKDTPTKVTQEDHERAVFDTLFDESKPYEERRAAAQKLQQARLK